MKKPYLLATGTQWRYTAYELSYNGVAFKKVKVLLVSREFYFVYMCKVKMIGPSTIGTIINVHECPG